jgi:aminomethyltransferase
MTTTTELLRTPLHDWHVAHGGRMVDFAGWSMPVQYKSIADEHNATRNAVGVFDISHMGRLEFFGDKMGTFLDAIVTRRVADMKPGQIRYALVCNMEGGILDDVLVYKSPGGAAGAYSMVVNASNRRKIMEWLPNRWCDLNLTPGDSRSHSVGDNTYESAMIAVQGPKAAVVLSPLFDGGKSKTDLSGIPYYHCVQARIDGNNSLVSRTGYTGEDGYEIICNKKVAPQVWQRSVDAATSLGGMACGLGARDTLRLEAAMPLYGHELSETINPIQAGLNFAVNLKDRKFIGSEALAKFAADKSQPVRIGLQCDGKRVPRQGCPVHHNGTIVGEVTSGTFSPTLNHPIAMAYVEPSASAIGTQLSTDIRGTHHPAVAVPLPFYQRRKKN